MLDFTSSTWVIVQSLQGFAELSVSLFVSVSIFIAALSRNLATVSQPS